MLCRSYILCAALMLLSGRGFSDSIIIDYSVAPDGNTALGPNTYTYTYSVDNNGTLPGMVPVQAFDIYFDTTLYQNLSLTDVSTQQVESAWMPEIFYSVGTEPAAFDADAGSQTGSGIAVGDSVSGFAVEFNYLGQGSPGTQPFDIYDPSTFSVIQSSVTQQAPGAPEPSTGSCILGVLLACGVWTVRRKLVQPIRHG